MRMIFKTFLVVTILLLMTDSAFAGGIHFSQPSINGRDVTDKTPFPVGKDQQVELCFNMEGYSYSGRTYEPSYAVFDVAELSSSGKVQQGTTFFVKRFDRLASRDYDENEFEIRHCAYFKTPVRFGLYVIRYRSVLMFPSDFHVHRVDEHEMGFYAQRHIKNYPHVFQTLARFQVLEHPQEDSDSLVSTYLHLDGKVPAVGAHVESGLNRPPVVFSWFNKPEKKDAEYRYRLYPIEPDWSIWSSESKATYHFIWPGAYRFQVVTRVRSTSGQWIEGKQAEYQFFLEKPLIAKPILKASQGIVAGHTSINLTNLYQRSRALLIGVTEYEDKQFGPLPYITADVDHLVSTLGRVGFDEVTPMKGSLTKTQITKAIDKFARSALKDERLLIYLSTHGFSDSLDRNKGYIVSTDCHTDQPTTCLSLQELNSILEPVLRAGNKPIRHLLILLDSCSSGLGVIAKSGRYDEFPVAAKDGAHLITAGLADQKAEQDPNLGMSTFTYYLEKGLSGEADYTQDGVVSLSELLVYVRYNVANRTNGRQTPMMGRLSGAGEMIFPASKH